jgi:hypothetical protein
VGIALLYNFIKSHVFTVLPTASQMNWSQMELSFVCSPVDSSIKVTTLEAAGHLSGKANRGS